MIKVNCISVSNEIVLNFDSLLGKKLDGDKKKFLLFNL